MICVGIMSVKIILYYIHSLCIIITMTDEYRVSASACVWRGEVDGFCGSLVGGEGEVLRKMNYIIIIICIYK